MKLKTWQWVLLAVVILLAADWAYFGVSPWAAAKEGFQRGYDAGMGGK